MIDTIGASKFVTYADWPSGVMAMQLGFKLSPIVVVTVFVVVSMTDTLKEPKLVTYAKCPSAVMAMLVFFGCLLWRSRLALLFRLWVWRYGRHRDALAVLQQSFDRAAFRHAFAACIFEQISLAGHHDLAVA